MVQIKEFRIVMPMSMEEYEIGLSYTIMKMEQQNTNSKEGVEVLRQVPFEDEKLGKGQFTSKVYHLQSKIPSWMKGFAPSSALTVHEDSWCAFPKSRTVIKCPLFSKCSLTIDTVTRPDNGCSENVHNLTSEQLAAREVEIIDIASISRDYWSKVIGAPNVDLTTFKSQRTERGPLLKGWMDSCVPVMTTYKLLIMDAPIWGLGERLEDCIIAGERALFLACHRLCFAWIDEWYGMTMEQIREMERQTDMLLKKLRRCFIADAEKAREGREQARGQQEDAQRRDSGRGELHVVLDC
ncbi:phosphatidylinositol transfer protein 2 isoform X1 [Sorghum bicolor]|uniref:phosphatidylinositol transfer protein 2 isoform X1 n=1 Tax=Sorghum bicolor TaxID=4558 RepID=UPI000B424D6B|nr:phosphatidylinositol transfer protein 2 isoform X1 [Sorghum bicolor]|eukprot:XP_021307053.1 phosphatidylinositol transfer protein 2 isoform X1 [Sorghum bicolor]